MQATKHDIFAVRRGSAIPGQPIVDPADWTAQEMATSDEWCYELTAQEIEEMRTAVAPFEREGVDVMPLTRSDFPPPDTGRQTARPPRGTALRSGLWHDPRPSGR